MLVQKYQGDIGFIKMAKDQIPSLKSATRIMSMIVAEGEVTGHNHVIETETPDLVQVFGFNNGTRVVVVEEGGDAASVHPEHDKFSLEPGEWLVVRQREDTGEGVRMVRD